MNQQEKIDEAQQLAFRHEFERLNKDPGRICLELRKVEAFILFAQLQLALKHPSNSGSSAMIARGIAFQLEQHVANDSEILRSIARAGWMSRFDSVVIPPQGEQVQALCNEIKNLKHQLRLAFLAGSSAGIDFERIGSGSLAKWEEARFEKFCKAANLEIPPPQQEAL